MNRHLFTDWAPFFDALKSSALPLFMSLTLVAFIGAVDMWLAGLVGGDAQAAVGIADQILFLTVLFATGLSGGVASCVARAVGARQTRLAKLYARDAMLAALLLGLISTALSLMFARPLLQFLSSSATTTKLAIDYLTICSIANTPWCLSVCQSSILRAVGKAKQCVLIWSIITSVSVGLALGVFCFSPANSFLLNLIAVTWVLGASAGCIVGFFCLQKVLATDSVFEGIVDTKYATECNVEYDTTTICDTASDTNRLALDTEGNTSGDTTSEITSTVLKRIIQFVEIGLPIALTEAGWIVSNFCTYKIFATFPTGVDAQAAWTIRMKLDELIFLTPIMAMSMTAATLAGQHLGAGNAKLARRVTLQIALVSCLVSFAVSVAMSSFSTSIACCFSKESEIIGFTCLLIDAAPWILPVMSVYLILFGAMEGAGFTRLPMIAIMTGLFFVRLPTSWLFGVVLDKQVPGVVAAVLMSNLVLAIWACALFGSKKWERTGC